jgi:hypothetical protein
VELDAAVSATEDWRVGLSDDQLRDLLYLLKLCRYFDERMEALYRQGRLPGAIYSGRGQEGTHVGVAAAFAYLLGGLLLDRTTPRVAFVAAGTAGLLATAATALALRRARPPATF